MKVSILCIAFNHEKYIRDALEGFVNQKTDFDFEVIVHDDASTDRTADIIKEYAEKYPHLIKPILQMENQFSKRVDICREIMFPVATGSYIATCEGDDYWIDTQKLQLQVDFLDQNPQYSACVHNSYKQEMLTGKKTVLYGTQDCDLYTTHVLNGGACCYQTASLMFRREAFYDFPPFLPVFHDYPFSIHLSFLGPIRYMSRVMSVYRFGTESSSVSAARKDMRRTAEIYKYVIDLLRQVNEYTNFVYDGQIKELITYNTYKVLFFEEKYSDMRKPEYQHLYRKESLSTRIKMRLKQYFAQLYHLYRKQKYGKT